MEKVINYYNNYDEDNRISSSNSRKIEFLLTTNILDNYIKQNDNILEVGAGTGVYSFYYAEKGNNVIATDVTPRNVEIMNNKLKERKKDLNLLAEIVDGTDLSRYDSESFDVVTCLGPIYHLTDRELRKKCINESLRVLKKNGVLAIAYINKHYVMHQVMLRDKKFIYKEFIDKMISSGTFYEGEKECFWTDNFFTTPTEMEKFLDEFNVDILEHIGTDGISPLIRNEIDHMGEDEYNQWLYYMINSCNDRDILGMSNHGLILVRK